MAESADAPDSGSGECKFMRVQVPSSAPKGGYNLNDFCPLFLLWDLNPNEYLQQKYTDVIFAKRKY